VRTDPGLREFMDILGPEIRELRTPPSRLRQDCDLRIARQSDRPDQRGPRRNAAHAQPVDHAHLEVTDVDRAHADAVARGFPIVVPLTNEPWNVRQFTPFRERRRPAARFGFVKLLAQKRFCLIRA